MGNINLLKEYYKRVCSPLVFVNETNLDNNKSAKVYLYDFKDKEELNNFKKVFQEYLPFYVRNFDRINRYNIVDNDKEIGKMLIDKAKQIKLNGGLIPNRPTEMDGIYGEVYNDFYIRNVIGMDRLITYLSRRSYERPRSENKGIDIVGCMLDGDTVEIAFSESKFVANVSSAKNKLIEDTESHVNKEYINRVLKFCYAKTRRCNRREGNKNK